MLPVRFDRLRPGNFVDDIEQQWHKLVDSFFAPPHVNDLKNRLKTNSGYPRVDVFTTADRYVVQASVCGVSPDDVQVEIFEEGGGRYLRISGQMAEEHAHRDEECAFRMKELRKGSFVRVLPLPDEVEGDPDASIKDGIVTLTWKLPRALARSPDVRRIPLKKD